MKSLTVSESQSQAKLEIEVKKEKVETEEKMSQNLEINATGDFSFKISKLKYPSLFEFKFSSLDDRCQV